MKKRITGLLLIAMFSFTAVFSQTTKQYAEGDMSTLLVDLESAVDGDVFELTTSGGIYGVDAKSLEVHADITIRAAADLTARPVVKMLQNENTDVDFLVRLKGADVALVLDGIELQGDSTKTKYAIRTAKIGDLTDYSGYDDPLYDGITVVQSYDLTITNCDINGITSGSDGRGIIMYPATRAGLLKIENTTMSAINRDGINAYLDTDDLNGNGHWLFADSIAIINSTFHHIGRDVITIRSSDTSEVSGMHKLLLDHVTFDSCGWNNSDPGKYHSLEIDYVNATITNCAFTNDISDDYIVRLDNTNASLNNIGVFNLGLNDAGMADTLDLQESAMLSDELIAGDPMYANAPNGDYTLGAGSAFIGAASDGLSIGDTKWYLAEARLTNLTVDGTTVTDFNDATLAYTIELAYGADIPVVAGVVLDGRSEAVVTSPEELPGDATVVVTAADGTTTLTYTVSFTIAADTDPSLSDLTANSTTISGFDAEVLTYDLRIPYGSTVTDIPTIAGVANNTSASVVSTQATTLPGTATVVVKSVDESQTLTYTVNISVQATREYSSDQVGALLTDLIAAIDGDEFVLTTSGGIYGIDSTCLEVHADIIIRAADGLTDRPIVKMLQNEYTDVDFLVRLKGADVSLVLDGIELQGDNDKTKYAIRTAKIGDLTDYNGYDDPNYDGTTVVQSYDLTISNCDINGIKSGSDGRGIIMYPATRARLLKIENTVMSDVNRDGINAYLDTDDLNGNGHWLFADSIAIINSTFHHIGRDAITIRSSDTSAVSGMHKLLLDHVTFDSIGWNNSDPGKYHSLEIDYVDATITNCIFSNDISDDYIVRLDNTNASLNNIGVFNLGLGDAGMSDTLDLQESAMLSDELIVGDPLYADAANGDYTLGAGSAFSVKASDGYALGDMRWDMVEARLADLTVDGVTVLGFDAAIYEYSYNLPFGTTTVPTIGGDALHPAATVDTTQATEVPGAATLVVTAKDGVTQLTYTVNYILGPSNIAKLSDLTVDNVTIAGFHPDSLSYDIELDPFTVEVPLVMATTLSPVATFEMVSATTLPGTWLINVTAEDMVTELSYAVNFTVREASDESSLSDILIDGESLEGFDDSMLEYTVELDYGTTETPMVEGIVTDESASAVNNQATELPGDATVVVTAEDGSMSTYVVHFTIAAPPTYTVSFTVVDENANALEGASVDFNGSTMTTNAAGVAIFTEVAMVTDAAYTVTYGDVTPYEGMVSVIDQDVMVDVIINLVGINQQSLVVGDVYPNPTNGKVHFTLNSKVSNATLIVTDMSGKVVINRDLSEVETTLDLSGNTEGVYFINIISGENNYMTKVILK